jgi:hypothetical protein
MKGIWGFQGSIDRSYPVALGGSQAARASDFVPFYRGILIGFGSGNCTEPLFQPRIISAIGAMFSFARMSNR